MKNKVCKISLFSAILATVTGLPVDARVVNSNNAARSYAGAYNQVNAISAQQQYLDATATNATTASATANLPVMVADEKLASAILNNSSETTISDLDACAMIYPNGVFRWEIPESGIRQNPVNQCVAVVSLIDANSSAVLATTTVAAGDSFKCNIDSFPESGMNEAALSKVEFPADKAPTMEDVESVMNEEQKQNAGLKIAAGAIISGVAGNLLAKKEAGDTKMFGATKTRLIDTAIGAAAGAGVMAASSYGGKVAGDTIKSTAVNAASGMVVGNMLAGANGGDGYLDIQKCNISAVKSDDPASSSIAKYIGQHDCIIGKVSEKKDEDIATRAGKKYFINQAGEVKECSEGNEDNTKFKKCIRYTIKVTDVELAGERGNKTFNEVFVYQKQNSEHQFLSRFTPDKETGTVLTQDKNRGVADDTYYEIISAKETENEQDAYIVFQGDVPKNIKGYKAKDIEELKCGKGAAGCQPTGETFAYFLRNSDGSVGSGLVQEENKTYEFRAISRKASDGGLVDLNNQARVKGTLVGTAAGGALGGFAGYQGAKTELTDRWTAAVREYEDSLSTFVCMTGTRYLSKYNDYVEIPELKKSE